jgi:hypothetical protein
MVMPDAMLDIPVNVVLNNKARVRAFMAVNLITSASLFTV